MDDVVRALDAALRGEPSGSRAGAQAPASGGRVDPRSYRPPASAGPAGSRPPPPLVDPALATQLQRYSTAEVSEILARAVDRQEAERAGSQASAGLGFDDLVAAAREVGVDPEVLRAASRELRAKKEAPQGWAAERDAWLRRRKRGFYKHLGVWVIVNVAFMLMGLVDRGSDPTQFFVPGLLWGIGLAIQGMKAFMADEDDWREEKEKKEKKERKKHRRSQAVERALDQGAAALLETGKLLRQRIATPPAVQGDAGSRVRVAAGATAAEREAASEEEAAAVERARAEMPRR
jgi:serine/threonine-protein kinase